MISQPTLRSRKPGFNKSIHKKQMFVQTSGRPIAPTKKSHWKIYVLLFLFLVTAIFCVLAAVPFILKAIFNYLSGTISAFVGTHSFEQLLLCLGLFFLVEVFFIWKVTKKTSLEDRTAMMGNNQAFACSVIGIVLVVIISLPWTLLPAMDVLMAPAIYCQKVVAVCH